MFRRGTPITELPPGYQIDLDRLPYSPGGCVTSPMLLIVLLLPVLVAMVLLAIWGFSSSVGSGAESTAVPSSVLDAAWDVQATNTPDSWSLTGTALFLATTTATFTPTATTDFCAFLTPTATATPTLIYTPDAWQLRGTEVWLEEHPPTETPVPQPTTPKSWCDFYLTPSPTRTRIVGTIIPTAEPTATATPTRQFADLVDPGNLYTYPTIEAPYHDPGPIVAPPTPLPLPTTLPTVKPTRDKPDRTATNTSTVSPTPTPSPTASATYPAVWTPSAALVVLSASCDSGMPEFELAPVAAGTVTVNYRLLRNRLPFESGVLIVQGRQTFAFLNATQPGRYHLEIDGERIARVDCHHDLVPVLATPLPAGGVSE